MSKFIVLDDSKSFLAAFETEAQAKQYASNNSDLAGYINNEKITEELSEDSYEMPRNPLTTPSIQGPSTIRTTENRVNALTAAEAIAEIKASQATQVADIITALIAYEGYLEMDKPHKYVIQTLADLGYYTESTDSKLIVKVEDSIE